MLELDSFGNLMSDSTLGFDIPIGFGGGLADPLTGLVRFGLRDYDPVAGRWTARDPIRFAGGQDNLFVYVSNDPVNLRDPLGLFCIGVSAYLLIGGGAEICIDDGDFSVCGELGFGLGGSVDANGDDVAKNGAKVLAEFEAKCGPIGGETGVSLDDRGCLKTKLKAELVRYRRKWQSRRNKGNKGLLRWEVRSRGQVGLQGLRAY
jgi:RHS repeat-associated protein